MKIPFADQCIPNELLSIHCDGQTRDRSNYQVLRTKVSALQRLCCHLSMLLSMCVGNFTALPMKKRPANVSNPFKTATSWALNFEAIRQSCKSLNIRSILPGLFLTWKVPLQRLVRSNSTPAQTSLLRKVRLSFQQLRVAIHPSKSRTICKKPSRATP